MSGSTLALVRHGRTEWNRLGLLQGRSDIPLDEVGQEQARAVAAMLADEEWDTVITSTAARAVGTGRIIAAHLGVSTATPVPALVERSYGAAEGLSRAHAEARWPDGHYPGLESLAAVAARGRRALDSIAAAHPSCRIVVVAHGALIRAVLADLSGAPVPRILNGAVSEIEWSHGWAVRSVNRTPGPSSPPRTPGRLTEAR